MTTLEARFRIVTPMFLGDADQKATAIRPPSIKGALRFWWRALNWGKDSRNSAEDAAAALKQLHQRESALFGSSEEGKGQAAFLLRVSDSRCKAQQTVDFTNAALGYLLGQGLYNLKTHLTRTYLTGEFSIELRFRPGTASTLVQEVEQAVLMFGLLGGLGSRSRRGFGSVSIMSLSRNKDSIGVPENTAAYQQALRSLAGNRGDTLPPFTAFSSRTRIVVVPGMKDALATLAIAGSEMQMYRGWGRHVKVNGIDAEQNFPDDHNLAQVAAKGSRPDHSPRRVVFGLPHNYFFSSTGDKLDLTLIGDNVNRRASPLLIHTHFLPDGQHLLVQTLLPATFAGHAHRLEFKAAPKAGKRSTHQLDVPVEVDWGVLDGYLARFKNAQQVLP